MSNWATSKLKVTHTLLIKNSMKSGIIALIVYVDDIIITCDDYDEIAYLKAHLARELKINNLKNLRYFLRIKVARSRYGIYISQQKYT